MLTGSSGGTAPAIVRALVDRGARRLLLLSRRPPAAATLAMITAAGGRALVAAVDVGDGPALAAALQRARDELGPLAGVVHAAGVLQDGMVASLTAAGLREALWPKLIGALHLHAATRGDDLQFFVALSSVAGWFGSPGQAAYAAANSALDAFAAARTAAGLPATAIAFGPWRDVGMAARLDERHRQRLRRRGFGFLAAAAAAAHLVRHRNTAAAIAVMHFEPEPGPAPRPAPNSASNSTPNSAPGLPTASPIVAPTTAATPAASLRERVRAAVARALGFADATQLDASTSFRDLGLDSLLAVDAKDHLEDLIGRPLPATLLFEHQDLDRLVAWLERLLATPG
ncbi:MAG: SDR family NAD(P)-dependent oxidoreductase [Planctomycetes bacterium]|nr:SDR family NAD(P)-dependent oxidoreductase [Planctomycetota bacterium]